MVFPTSLRPEAVQMRPRSGFSGSINAQQQPTPRRYHDLTCTNLPGLPLTRRHHAGGAGPCPVRRNPPNVRCRRRRHQD
ncbi:hypothetical protein [Desulfofustis limnaeus]|uniref:hypothetical protein n=1 Tax=Desulfofustis limnaeus TaxID=2740163 RepID=UPI0024DF9FD7|nr:hypothetical protein [Desulfofustis limnaeus]MDX9896991.1 hypothetical protein [Desulfofustis sp.]